MIRFETIQAVTFALGLSLVLFFVVSGLRWFFRRVTGKARYSRTIVG